MPLVCMRTVISKTPVLFGVPEKDSFPSLAMFSVSQSAEIDALVEEREGASVADVFRYEGEERFREAERRVLDEVIAGASFAVVSTGGGLPTWRDNMPCMNAVGHTVYLRRSPEQIARRLSPYGRRKRPRLQGLDDEQLVAFMRGDMAAREPFYAQASLVVDCDLMSDDELVEHIVQTFSDRG